MKDNLKNLLQERFQGHEAPVDPATWQVIEARLLTTAPATDQVNDLFRERFQQHEVNVDPSVWQGISSQLGHGAGAGLLGGYGWVAAGLGGVIAIGGLIYALSGSGPDTTLSSTRPEGSTAQVITEQPDGPGQAPTNAQPVLVIPSESTEQRAPMVREHRSTSALEPTAQLQPPSEPVTPPTEVPQRQDMDPELVDRIMKEITGRVEEDVRAGVDTNIALPGAVTPPAGTDDDMAPHQAQQSPPCPKPYMPNTFTPNNDGVNDAYVVNQEGYTSMLLRVYSMKSNQLVFSTNNGEPWTGANCEDGWYMVAAEALTTEGCMVSEGKVVWLNRSGMN